MNCTEFAEWTGPWLSGEIDSVRRAAFDSHRAACPACNESLENTIGADAWLRRVTLAENADPARVLMETRRTLATQTRVKWWVGLAAAALFSLAGAGYYFNTAQPAPTAVFTAAAKDHRLEVLQNRPRRWRATRAAMQPLLDQYKVTSSDAERLLPAGFVLEKAKECGLNGQPTLHLVFSDGHRALSVYVKTTGTEPDIEAATLDGAEVGSFRRGGISGLVVATSPGLCTEAVRRLSAL
ncbi:MAG: hypothetical protein JWN34_405 [Bryobacterales bacterium]|nr:hypothetical protein [Bryobacterales bacterium]